MIKGSPFAEGHTNRLSGLTDVACGPQTIRDLKAAGMKVWVLTGAYRDGTGDVLEGNVV